MKKCLVVLMVFVLAVAAFSTVVSAAPSPEGGMISETATGVDSNGNPVHIKIVDAKERPVTPFEPEFNKLKSKDGSLDILSHVELIADGDVSQIKFPIKINIPVSGATAGSKGYFLLRKADGTVVKLDATMGDGVATATFPELGEVVFVSDMNAEDIGTPDNGKGGKLGLTGNLGDVMKESATIALQYLK